MRGKWNHKAPEAHQDEPADNTSVYVWRQARLYVRSSGQPSLLIHPEVAMEIAAWFHSPAKRDEVISAFSSNGTIMEGLAEWIEQEIHVQVRHDNKEVLRALLDYVKACTVTPWAAGKNRPGFLPDNPPTLHLDYQDAVMALDGLLDDMPADITGSDECLCPEDGAGESCTGCVMESMATQDKREHLPSFAGNGQVFGKVGPLEFTYRDPDSGANETCYFVQPGQEMTYGDYLKQRDSE